MFRRRKVEKLTRDVLAKSSVFLTTSDIENAVDLIEHNECGVAFELICQQLYEYDADVPESLFTCISDAGRLMEFDETAWNFLARAGPV